jgi:hypothetical protein
MDANHERSLQTARLIPPKQDWIHRKSTGEVFYRGKRKGMFCGRCGGTGRYITGSLNGQLTGPGGECFRCNGKGYQTPLDHERNERYDSRAAAAAIRGDFNAAA